MSDLAIDAHDGSEERPIKPAIMNGGLPSNVRFIPMQGQSGGLTVAVTIGAAKLPPRRFHRERLARQHGDRQHDWQNAPAYRWKFPMTHS